MTEANATRGAARAWFDRPLRILGILLMLFGGTFFIFVSSVGAPVVPYGGLLIASFGLWIAFMRRSGPEPDRADERQSHSE